MRPGPVRWRSWCIEAARQEAGLDEYEVRSATGWHRHVTLALWALALLDVLRATTLPEAALPFKKRGLYAEVDGRSGIRQTVSTDTEPGQDRAPLGRPLSATSL